ncbi:MAG: uroporphyrinogen-III C-methyltransferase [Chloroflexales bacterium]|nr:uroporphyrinogen-III C-methyltransferase [Chloroflexales bacterium]
MSQGFVSLVGAGPGDPELITLKGLRRLRAAEVVVHDALIGRELLEECRPDAEIIDAGKRAGGPARPQLWINRLLVERAQRGQQVVRLKGGDPFIFGRGAEEAEALVAAGVAWEVVPGVSSAVAAPAYAGIPLTHRSHAASFAVVTGHEPADRAASRLHWQALAHGIDTLVFLMGTGRLAEISARLIEAGRPAATPAAVVRWGTTADQTLAVATLATISATVAQAGIAPPALLVVGDVVGLHQTLAWFDPARARPLTLPTAAD